MPEQASEFAPKVDWINNLITDISVFFTVAIVGAMIYFAIKYRQRNGKDHDTPQIEGSHFFEMVWTIVPTIICIFVAGYGYVVFDEIRSAPTDAMTINVKARSWAWDFEYMRGSEKKPKLTTNELIVPVDQPVKLVMTSTDVLHSFFIPAMRVKNDAIPKQYSYLWFKPVKTGEYHVFCTEYCGKDHSQMRAQLKVVSRAEYDRWLNDDSDLLKLSRMNPVDIGKELYTKKGCNACHSLNGNPGVGPSFLKVYGKEEELATGEKVKVDENYIKTSIINPNAQVVKGYQPQMPSFSGQLSDDEIHGIIEFIKTIDGSAQVEVVAPKKDEAALAAMSPAERGKAIYAEKGCNACHSLDGTKVLGPSFKGIYGRKGKLVDGSEYEANDAYIKNSILKPQSQVVEGFQPVMPPFEGQLDDKAIADVIEFMKTVK